ncbi:SLATT domain-containing protein [Parascardovia denticolens]|uniref:SLATT domain-containing protein n=1 Tax=Parascardovia denticolens TaxID=78258 RepID=UPI00248D8DCA|nr:SLATT domain-containing protein [Parascardovia denticolens]
MQDDFKVLETSVRYTFGTVMWSHKIQEKQADIYKKLQRVLTLFILIFSALTSAGVISLFFNFIKIPSQAIKVVSTLLSFCTTLLSTFAQRTNFDKLAQAHSQAATSYLHLKHQLELLLMKIHLANTSFNDIEETYEKLVSQIDDLNAHSPRTTNHAVKLASKALHISHDDNITDEEIDSGLPQLFHIGAFHE